MLDDAFEGTLHMTLDDGRELSTLVFGLEHAKRVLARWADGDCGDDYQTAAGDFRPCAREAGHTGYCSHRRTS